MSVLKDILNWSKTIPKWQRDALRRLLSVEKLSVTDLADLAKLCKAAHLLTAPEDSLPEAKPLAEEHLPADVETSSPVVLSAIRNIQNVNIISSKQPLTFGDSGLSVVYGDNASGKSGYARILKLACRARSKPKRILPNIFSTSATGISEAVIDFKLGNDDGSYHWTEGQGGSAILASVSVFDSACALYYVEEANDVAFRPFGLDLLDKLASACSHLKIGFEQERLTLTIAAKDFFDLQGQTAVGKLVNMLNASTSTEAVEKLATLSQEELKNLESLKKQVAQIEADDPTVRAKELNGRATRLEQLKMQLVQINTALSDDSIRGLRESSASVNSTTEASRLASSAAFKDEPLKGVGSETWQELWKAARQFSDAEVFIDKLFPVTDGDAACVLCQQALSPEAIKRFSRFEDFVKGETQQAAAKAKTRFDDINKAFLENTQNLTAPDDLLAQLDSTNQECATKVRDFLSKASDRKMFILSALTVNTWEAIPIVSQCPTQQIDTIVTELKLKAAEFERAKVPENLAELKSKRDELTARSKLNVRKNDVLNEIARLKKMSALNQCFADIDTYSISRTSTKLTEAYVTAAICDRFKVELGRLGLNHLQVQLAPAGSERGVMYHRVEFKSKRSVGIREVVSEGEYRCIALAGFLAELATSPVKSALVFDDPVSSLDHVWREAVASRLVVEAKDRQVIVLTHDLVFLLLLIEHCDAANVQSTQAHILRTSSGTGETQVGPPWLAAQVKTRVGVLKSRFQQAEKLFKEIDPAIYEAFACDLYGRLRETWERAIEELLLNDSVRRFRRSIETNRLTKLSDIKSEDVEFIEAAMTKCSKYLRGHDKAVAINESVPTPDELKADIESLENWVSEIRKRR
jgi:energy-coupling factor transporter ATP-binding protein EcfA2